MSMPRRRMTVVLGVIAVALSVSQAFAATQAGPLRGALDPTFGDGGRALSNLPPALASSGFSKVDVQPDGKLVLMGWIHSGGAEVIERRQPNGKLDWSFGQEGVTAVGHGFNLPFNTTGLALQSDGGIVYSETPPCGGEAPIKRLRPDGSLDTSFAGGSGAQVLHFGLAELMLDSENRILVLGSTPNTACSPRPSQAQSRVELARLLPNGALDPSFGTGGLLELSIEGQALAGAESLAVREDGTIVISGTPAYGSKHFLVALSPNGDLNPSFGNGGIVSVPPSTGKLMALPGNSVLSLSHYVCSCRQPDGGEIVLRRYLGDGQLDQTFGASGVARVAPVPNSLLEAFAQGPGGTVLLAGRTEPAPNCKGPACAAVGFLARVTGAGSLDPNFGKGGWLRLGVQSNDPSHSPHTPGLAIAPSGQLYLAAEAGEKAQGFILGREANGAPNPSFGANGIVEETGTVASNTRSIAAALEPNGETVVFGSTNSGSLSGHNVLIHFRPDGSLNTRFGSGSGFVLTEQLGILAPAGGGSVYSVRKPGRVVRIGPKGKEDPAYGDGGEMPLPPAFGPRTLVAHDGKLLVAGIEANRRMAAFQLDGRGRPDRSFGRAGLVVVHGRGSSAARSAAVDARGRILLFGAGPNASPQLARLLPDGLPDRSFGHDGVRVGLPLRHLRASQLAPLPGGGLVVATAAPATGNIHGLRTSLLRLDERGRIVRSFGDHGLIRIDGFGSPLAVFPSPRQLVLATGPPPLSHAGLALRAYRLDGRADRGFGQGGVVRERSTSTLHFGALFAGRQRGGRVVVVGNATHRYGPAEVELLRFR